MIEGAIGGLIVAWILALFGFDDICAQALNEWFGITVSSASYYFAAFIIGGIAGFFGRSVF